MAGKEGFRWKRADESDEFGCLPNHTEHGIFYARTKTTDRDFSYSDSNQLIHNLKKAPNRPASQLYWKDQAIAQFAREALTLINDPSWKKHEILLCPIPPSKVPGNPLYDDRLNRVAQSICAGAKHVQYFPLLEGRADRDAAHESSGTRSAQAMYEAMRVNRTVARQYEDGPGIIVLDDVTTSGATIAAAFRHIQETMPGAPMLAVLWAKARGVPAEEIFGEVDP